MAGRLYSLLLATNIACYTNVWRVKYDIRLSDEDEILTCDMLTSRPEQTAL